MKKSKPLKQYHTSDSKKGMGDFYGSAVKNLVGKPREIMGMKVMDKKKTKTPPKSMA